MNIPDPIPAFESFWRFAAERHGIYQSRLAGAEPSWTNNPVLQQWKFTNCFRIADRTTQYLIGQVIYNPHAPSDAEETVFRILLYKFFNRISTWEQIVKAFGTPTWKNFDEPSYVAVLDKIAETGGKIFSAAYMHNDLKNYAHVSKRKHPRYIRLLREMMQDDVTGKLQAARTYRDAFRVLHSYPLHENFVGMQHLTDINYSTVVNFDEDDFILPGPGALRGTQRCFDYGRKPTVPEAVECIDACVEGQVAFFQHFGLKPVTICGRMLHSVDCQSLFCELDKFCRVATPQLNLERTRMKQKFRPSGPLSPPCFPPKWGLSSAARNSLSR